MSEQLQLAMKSAKPVITAEEVDYVCEVLSIRKGWVRARVLESELDIDERTLRLAAEHSNGRILSGQNGYRFFDRNTSFDEADRAATWLESQGRKMIARGMAIRRRAHRITQLKPEKNVTPATAAIPAPAAARLEA